MDEVRWPSPYHERVYKIWSGSGLGSNASDLDETMSLGSVRSQVSSTTVKSRSNLRGYFGLSHHASSRNEYGRLTPPITMGSQMHQSY